MKTNAKDEFLMETVRKDVVCAETWPHIHRPSSPPPARLPVLYTLEEYMLFLAALDFEYDAGYGGQELFGTIWYADGSWSDRGEYDGSEWWEHHTVPDIPVYLTNK